MIERFVYFYKNKEIFFLILPFLARFIVFKGFGDERESCKLLMLCHLHVILINIKKLD